MLFQNYPTIGFYNQSSMLYRQKAHVSEVKWPDPLQIKFKAKVHLAAAAMKDEIIKIPSLWNVFLAQLL
jgi:hypothetical protein